MIVCSPGSAATTQVPFRPAGVIGVTALQSVYRDQPDRPAPETVVCPQSEVDAVLRKVSGWPGLLRELEAEGKGAIMTMGTKSIDELPEAVKTPITGNIATRIHSCILSS